jgi:hypothetical protein
VVPNDRIHHEEGTKICGCLPGLAPLTIHAVLAGQSRDKGMLIGL